MKKRVGVLIGVSLLSLFLLAALVVMSESIQGSTNFGQVFSALLIFNSIGLITFLVLIGTNIRRLWGQLRARAPGSRLTLRMVLLFVVLAVTPVLLVYGFSLDFLRRGIDSWFDVEVESALDDALKLSQTSLEVQKREALRRTEALARELSGTGSGGGNRLDLQELRDSSSVVVVSQFEGDTAELSRLLERSGAEELLLLSDTGELLSSTSRETDVVPEMPSEQALLQVRQGSRSIGLIPRADDSILIRAIVEVPSLSFGGDTRYLQAVYPLPEELSLLAKRVESAYARYREFAYLREQLKLSFIMTLTLVLLYAIFAAVWAAFYSARRLAAPISDLAQGTRDVAKGDYSTQLPVKTADDLGFLVQSFNAMTRRISTAREAVERSRDEVDAQRQFLEGVLKRLSSGVVVLDDSGEVLRANQSAQDILQLNDDPTASPVEELASAYPRLGDFVNLLANRAHEHEADWQEQVVLFGEQGRKELMCRGAYIAGAEPADACHVVVFDDITAMVQGQKDAAWSEAARRLAHEIKNPLTPIQLSAERLRHKYLKTMAPEDAEALDRLTHTIVQQVETMKGMVNTFSEYARPPKMQTAEVDINALVAEAADLFRSAEPGIEFSLDLDPDNPCIKADSNRLRQVFNNLIKNALEATIGRPNAQIEVRSRMAGDRGHRHLEITISDNGAGIDPAVLGRLFDPYVTNKPKGTGLGLAIVKKIIEEHGGLVWLENQPGAGAVARIQLPLSTVVPPVDSTPASERKTA